MAEFELDDHDELDADESEWEGIEPFSILEPEKPGEVTWVDSGTETEIPHELQATWSLIYSPDNATEHDRRVFDIVGSGYAWEQIARYLVEVEHPELGDDIDFDSESGMFAATSLEKEPLMALAGELATAFRHIRRLRELVGQATARSL